MDPVVSHLLDVIHSLAYQVAQYQYPNQFDYSDDQLRMITVCAGLDEKYWSERETNEM